MDQWYNLKSKTAFANACSTLWKEGEWVLRARRGDEIYIPPDLQEAILCGFRRFYPKTSPKYENIHHAKSLVWALDATRLPGCFAVVGSDGHRTTVSSRCSEPNIRNYIIQVCRGSIHRSQILPAKTRRSNQVDHCNEGGFLGVYTQWRKVCKRSDHDLYAFVVRHDAHSDDACMGFCTFTEPVLSEWLKFHADTALLQELSASEHQLFTNQRRN